MSHKIAITGGHCTGKTTLTRAIGEITRWEVSPEFARIAADQGYKLNMEADYGTQRFIMNAQIKWERGREGHNMVCDRSTIDALAHSTHMYCEGRMGEFHLKALATLALPWARTYDLHILTVPGDCPMVDDGVRSTDVEYQDSIFRQCRHLLTRYNIPHITVRGSVEERVGQVMAELRKRKIIGSG